MIRKHQVILLPGILLAFFLCRPAAAQKEIGLQELQVPTSPGFILLDAAPADIDRPATAKAFGLSILNSFNTKTFLPNDFGLEFIPFWFFRHPKMDPMKFLGMDPSLDQKIFSAVKFTGFSVSFVNQTDTAGKLSWNNVAFGASTTLVRWRDPDDARQLVMLDTLLTGRIAVIQEDLIINRNDTSREALARAISGDEILNACAGRIREILARRPVFEITGAAAVNLAFRNRDFSTLRTARAGIWLNMIFSKCLNKKRSGNKTNYINFYGFGRYLYDDALYRSDTSEGSQSLMDAGFRAELELGRFSLSGEYLHRFNLDQPVFDTFRASGLVRFRISEAIFVYGTLGKNFGKENNLITQLGVSLGIRSGNENVIQ
jgi:hypothetical protein